MGVVAQVRGHRAGLAGGVPVRLDVIMSLGLLVLLVAAVALFIAFPWLAQIVAGLVVASVVAGMVAALWGLR